MINSKKGLNVNIFSPTFIIGIILLIIFIIFLNKGGASVIENITEFLKTLPGWTYIVFGVLILFLMVRNNGGKRRRR